MPKKSKFPKVKLRESLTPAEIADAHQRVYDIINYTPDHHLAYTGIGRKHADRVQDSLGALLRILEAE